jgi:hypothetical protein
MQRAPTGSCDRATCWLAGWQAGVAISWYAAGVECRWARVQANHQDAMCSWTFNGRSVDGRDGCWMRLPALGSASWGNLTPEAQLHRQLLQPQTRPRKLPPLYTVHHYSRPQPAP